MNLESSFSQWYLAGLDCKNVTGKQLIPLIREACCELMC